MQKGKVLGFWKSYARDRQYLSHNVYFILMVK
jgi:hypothetical protein